MKLFWISNQNGHAEFHHPKLMGIIYTSLPKKKSVLSQSLAVCLWYLVRLFSSDIYSGKGWCLQVLEKVVCLLFGKNMQCALYQRLQKLHLVICRVVELKNSLMGLQQCAQVANAAGVYIHATLIGAIKEVYFIDRMATRPGWHSVHIYMSTYWY